MQLTSHLHRFGHKTGEYNLDWRTVTAPLVSQRADGHILSMGAQAQGNLVTDAPPESFVRVRAAMAAFRVQETPAIAAARAYGVDIGLLKESILRTPIERVQRNDEILATLAMMRHKR